MYKNNILPEDASAISDSNGIKNAYLSCSNPNNFGQSTPQRPQSYYQPNYEQVYIYKLF